MSFHSPLGQLRPIAVLVAVAAACAAPLAHAIEPFVLKDIRIEGLQRTDPGTVIASLPFRAGDLYNDEKGAAAVAALRCSCCHPCSCCCHRSGPNSRSD